MLENNVGIISHFLQWHKSQNGWAEQQSRTTRDPRKSANNPRNLSSSPASGGAGGATLPINCGQSPVEHARCPWRRCRHAVNTTMSVSLDGPLLPPNYAPPPSLPPTQPWGGRIMKAIRKEERGRHSLLRLNSQKALRIAREAPFHDRRQSVSHLERMI